MDIIKVENESYINVLDLSGWFDFYITEDIIIKKNQREYPYVSVKRVKDYLRNSIESYERKLVLFKELHVKLFLEE